MFTRLLTALLAASFLAGCANTDMLSGDVYSANQGKQVQNVTYGTILAVRPIKIQGGDESNLVGTLGGAILGGIAGNSVGGGNGRTLATLGGAALGGLAGRGAENMLNKSNGVELEIRHENGGTVAIVQKGDVTRFAVGQRVAIIQNGSEVTVSPR